MLSIIALVIFTLMDPIAQLQKGRDAKRKSDLSQIQKALEVYYQDNGRYAENPAQGDYRIKTIIAEEEEAVDWGSPWGPSYMPSLPKDPGSPSKHYIYVSNSPNQAYYLYASLDRGGLDPQACTGVNNACSGPSGSGIDMQTACGGVCNYGVTSANVSP